MSKWTCSNCNTTTDGGHTYDQCLDVLVQQRDDLLDSCKEVAVMLNTALKDYNDEPWAMRLRAAIEKAQQ